MPCPITKVPQSISETQFADEKMNPCDSRPSTFLGLLIQSRSTSCNSTHGYRSSELLRNLATQEFNAFLWLSLITVTTLLLRKVFKLFRLWHSAKKIPGPPCPSFFSHCKLISRENLTDLLFESHAKYGPIVKLWLGPTQLLVSVKDPVLIQEMLIKAKDKLPFTGKAFHLAFGKSSLFASSFEKVQKRRELLATELDQKLLKACDLIPKRVVDFIMDKIENIIARGSIDCRLISQDLAFTIMGATFFGEGFLACPKASIYEELLTMIAKDACFWASYNVTPLWKRGFWRYQCLCTKLKCLTQDIIQHCRRNCKRCSHFDQNVHSEISKIDLMAAHVAHCCPDDEFQDSNFFRQLNDHHSADEEPCGNIMCVMFHGCQSTATLIANLLNRLAMHPEIQDKVYSEISMLGRNPSKYEHEDVSRVPLLLATVFESARLLSTGTMLQRCSPKYDLKFSTGVTVPAGAVVVAPVTLVQMDGSSWGTDASDFNPYRFLSNGSAEEFTNPGFSSYVLNDPNENAAFLPFGSGTRACVGKKFAIQVVASMFVLLLKKYEIRLSSGSDDDPKPILKNHLLQHHPDSPILLVARDR